jgi:hypothetical protein
MPHPWASLPTMGVLPYLIYASEALFAYVISPKRDMRNLRAIRLIDRSVEYRLQFIMPQAENLLRRRNPRIADDLPPPAGR